MNFTRFRHLAIEGAGPRPTAAEIDAIEGLLGARLPEAFREFLDVGNGGNLEYTVDVEMGDGSSEPISFCGLFRTGPGSFCDETFLGEIRSCRETFKIPLGVLPLARDGGGSLVFLDLSPEGGGSVVAFVNGLPSWTGRRTESAFLSLAASFEEYVESLYVDRELIMDRLEHDVSDFSHVKAMEEFLDIGMPQWRHDAEIMLAIEQARGRVCA